MIRADVKAIVHAVAAGAQVVAYNQIWTLLLWSECGILNSEPTKYEAFNYLLAKKNGFSPLIEHLAAIDSAE